MIDISWTVKECSRPPGQLYPFLPDRQVLADGRPFMCLPGSMGPDNFEVHHIWRDGIGESDKQDHFPCGGPRTARGFLRKYWTCLLCLKKI